MDKTHIYPPRCIVSNMISAFATLKSVKKVFQALQIHHIKASYRKHSGYSGYGHSTF